MANSGIVGALRVLLGLDTAEFDTNVQKVKGKAKDLENDFTKFGKSFGSAFLPVASVAGAGLALAAFAKNAFDAAGQITDLSDATGLTTDSIQEMQLAADLTGTSLEAFTNAAFKLGVNLATGTEKVRDAVEALGLSYKTLREQSPDEQFKSIASALSDVEDVQLRNKLAVELFGKAAKEILPAIAQGYDEIADSATKTGEAQLQAIDEAGDALADFWQDFKSLSITVLGTTIIGLKDFFMTLTGAFRQARDEWGAILDVMTGKVSDLPKVAGPAAASLGQINAPLKDITMSLEDQAKAEKELEKAAKESLAANLKAIEARKQAAEQQATALRDYYNFLGLRRMEDEAAELKQIEDQAKAWREYYNWLGERRMEADAAAMVPPDLGGDIPLSQLLGDWDTQITPFVQSMQDKLRAIWDGMKEGLKKNLSDIPQTLANAFSNGGDITGALKSIVSQIGSTIGGSIGAAFGPMGAKIGAAIGSMAGMLVGGFKKLFGIGISDEIKKLNKQIAESQDKLIATYGSFDRIDRLGKAVGVDLAGAWKSQGEAGKKHFDQLAKDFEAAVAKMEADLEGFQSEFDDLLDKAADLGYEFDKAGNFTGVNFDKLKSKAEEFGVSVDGLGAGFRQQGIDAEAKNIIDGFTLMAKAGGDVGGILVGMKDEIGALVAKSITLGTTIPANMKPWIEELIRTHQLLDENGNEITDISKIKFADPIKTEFEKITLAITELITKIGDLIDRLAGIPTEKNVKITTDFQTTGDPTSHGYEGDEPFAAGGLVSRPTRALIGEGGEPELIGPVSFMSEALRGALDNLGGFLLPDVGSLLAPALAGATAPGGGPGTSQTIINNFSFEVSTLDTDELSRMIRRRIIPEINAQLGSVGDLRTGMRDGLGI